MAAATATRKMVAFWVPIEFSEQLKRQAAIEERSQTKVLELALRHYVENQQRLQAQLAELAAQQK